MRAFGLTGGVGMGKSAAAGWLRSWGVPVVDSDELARQVVEPGELALAEIRKAFGDEFIGPDGQLRREELARLVFQDPEARRRLEAITHPRIRAGWQTQLEQWRQIQVPLAFAVIPLLFETGAEAQFDASVCVACSPRLQKHRLLSRGWSPAGAQQRIDAQMPIERKMALATFVVWNDGTQQTLAAQLERILGLRRP